MKLRELFERQVPADAPAQPTTSVGVCFGRWNPPHKGHRAAWETAAEFDHFYIGTNQNTQGPNDPLPYDVKLIAMEAVWPEIAGHVIPETNLFTLASKIYAKYGDNVDLKVCTDEEWLTSGLSKHNGKEGKHGYYNFASISHVPTPRLSSATALRSAARRGDREEFSAAAGVPADTPIKVGKRAVRFFDLVSKYLNMYPEKAKKSVAESSQSKISKRKQQSTVGLNTYGDSERMSGDYTSYRLGMAVAGANGKDPLPIDMKAKSWIGKKKSTHPYTQEEQDMLKQAYDVVGADYQDLNKGDLRSLELDNVNKTSPVAKPKRNKYGI
jgi:hypothetical protein